MGLALLFRPWLNGKELAKSHQFWIGPALLVLRAGCMWTVSHLNSFSDPGVSPYLTGQLMATQSMETEERIRTMREMAHAKLQASNTATDLITIPVEDLPDFLKHHSWGPPRPVDLMPHVSGIEIDVWWGGALSGYFGLLIDPREQPTEGVFESPDGAFRWYRRVGKKCLFLPHQRLNPRTSSFSAPAINGVARRQRRCIKMIRV